jgi:hypothetical protein
MALKQTVTVPQKRRCRTFEKKAVKRIVEPRERKYQKYRGTSQFVV